MSLTKLADFKKNSSPIVEELTFLTQQTGQDETTILAKALHLGLSELYRQTIEQLFIDGVFSGEEALEVLGAERLADIEYAQHTLEQDIVQGLNL